MITKYKYRLDESSRKFRCPQCEKKRFVRYIISQTGEYLPEKYGRCDREENCRYHCSPYHDDLPNKLQKVNTLRHPQIEKRKSNTVKFIPFDLFNKSRNNYNQNHFITYLLSLFDKKTVTELVVKYHIGTSDNWPGATIFYQIDNLGRIRRGKIMLYDPVNGKRVKVPEPHISSVHAKLKLSEHKPDACLFGLHLVTPDKPIAICESEKTAIISSVYLPEFTWMAAGSINNLKKEMLRPIKDNSIYLFPDTGAYVKWSAIASRCSNVIASNLLETYSDEIARQQGYDLADYLIKFELEDFHKDGIHKHKNKTENNLAYPKSWDEIKPPEPRTQEDVDSVKATIQDAEPDELKLLMHKDPLLKEIIEVFNAEISIDH